MNLDGVNWKKLGLVADDRGCLTAIEGAHDVSFEIKRIFYMHDVVKGNDRGGHAHIDTDQLAVAVHGSVKIIVSDGRESRQFLLDHPGWGLTLPRMTWTKLVEFSEGAVCLVLASTHYDRGKSIRTWDDYLAARGISAGPEPDPGSMLHHPDHLSHRS